MYIKHLNPGVHSLTLLPCLCLWTCWREAPNAMLHLLLYVGTYSFYALEEMPLLTGDCHILLQIIYRTLPSLILL